MKVRLALNCHRIVLLNHFGRLQLNITHFFGTNIDFFLFFLQQKIVDLDFVDLKKFANDPFCLVSIRHFVTQERTLIIKHDNYFSIGRIPISNDH